jgi:poly(A) polymerase
MDCSTAICTEAPKGRHEIISPVVIPRSQHAISRANISEHALKVLYRLKGAGFQAHLVGGGVRDLLLGREPKDFDVATDALPEQVKQVFRNCRLIGRRFRLAHVHFGPEIIEVATFRALGGEEEIEGGDRLIQDGRIMRDNVYGTIAEDAWRRDFTVNGLYYNIEDFSVVDYVGGMEDLQAGVLRLIGEPMQRFREDPVRMLRAVRFAAKLGFRLHPDTEAAMLELAPLLADMPPARLFEETIKLFLAGHAVQTYELLRHYRLFGYLFPQTEHSLEREEQGFPLTLVTRALANTDGRIAEGKSVTPAFLFAALLWEPLRQIAEEMRTDEMGELDVLYHAGNEVVVRQAKRVALPKRFSLPMREIWALQPRFELRSGTRPQRFLAHPRFRAAYDFLLLRAEAGEAPEELAQWWTEFQSMNAEEQQRATRRTGTAKPRRRRRRRKPPPAE